MHQDTVGFPFFEWLGRPAEEVYAHLLEKDPPRLREACLRVLAEECSLLDPVRLWDDTRREVAFELELSTKEDLEGDWLGERVRRSMERLLSRDRADERSGQAFDPADFSYLRRIFSIAAAEARTASIAFHALPSRIRKIFFALVIEDRSLEECSAAGLGSEEELGEALWSVFAAARLVSQEEVDSHARRLLP